MYKGLNYLYESTLIREMDERVVEYIEDHKADELPFDNIFGDKMRITIPLVSDETASMLLHDLKNVKDFAGIDFDEHVVIRDIPLDPKYGGGKKTQRVNIGKAVQSLKIPDAKKKRYLDWLARYVNELKSMVTEHEYSIILSRAPIDIVRMSDHRNISSCHKQGDTYFKCAVQEALTGGAIAYLVYNDTLEQLSEDDYENADIFRDNERSVSGIEPPLARIRIRRLERDDETSWAFPEKRTYGDDSIPGFYNSIRDFLQSKQQLDKKEVATSLRNLDKYHHLRGGSYEDNNMIELINRYFDMNSSDEDNISGSGIYISQSGEDSRSEDHFNQNMIPDFDDALEVATNRVNASLSNDISVWYDYSRDDGEPHAIIGANHKYTFGDFNVSDDFECEFDESDLYDIRRAKKGAEWMSFYGTLRTIYSGDNLEVTGFSYDGSELNVSITSSNSNIIYDENDYTRFMRDVIDIDNRVDEIYDYIVETMINANFILDETDMYSRLREFEIAKSDETVDENEQWEHVQIEGESASTYTVTNKAERLLIEAHPNKFDAATLNLHNYIYGRTHSTKEAFNTILHNFYNDLFVSFNPVNTEEQLELPNVVSEAHITKDTQVKFSTNTLKLQVLGGKEIHFMESDIDIKMFNNTSFYFVDFLDVYWLHILNALRVWLVRHAEPDIQKAIMPNNFAMLLKLYGKYIP